MSGLTRKIIYVDKTLSAILGVKEGSLVSYSELSKGLHRYIKEKDLKNPKPAPSASTTPISVAPATLPTSTSAEEPTTICKACGEPIPDGAIFCDMCGVRQ
jgi:hypothetical protein